MSDRGVDPRSIAIQARDALAQGREADALPQTFAAAEKLSDASLWQWTALLQRALQDYPGAVRSFERAASLNSSDALIAMGRAQVAMEAGLPSRHLFDAALRLAPSGDALLGHASARLAEGDGDAALNDLAGVLAANPSWIEGHVQWAQLAALCGRADRATRTIDVALANEPASIPLWQAKIRILNLAERASDVWQACAEAEVATGAARPFLLAHASALSDDGQDQAAADAFARAGRPADVQHAIRLVRHLIRTGELSAAKTLTDDWMKGDDAHFFWPYASIVWRLADDDRYGWLEGDERLAQLFDVGPSIGPLEELRAHLDRLHDRSGRFLDQSVRGGTQTNGPLLSSIAPEILALRKGLVEAVEQYRDQLPTLDVTHPMLRHARIGPVRFAGSWSVRLSGAGFHTAHIHPQGWISSACYLKVPDVHDDEGALALGEPPADLRTGLRPTRVIRPKVGQLALFPSMMWHGTRPFPAGERMTVAFDVAPPRP